MHDWARNVGRRFADDFRRRRGANAEAFFEAEFLRGGPLLRLLRDDAEAGFRERLAEPEAAK